MAKVRLTNAERLKYTGYMHEAKRMYPHESWWQWMQRANRLMPDGRRLKPSGGPSCVPWLRDALERYTPPPPTVEQDIRPASVSVCTITSLAEIAQEQEAPIETETRVEPLHDLQRVIINAIADSIRETMRSIATSPELMQAIRDAVAMPLATQAQVVEALTATAKETKPRVAVVGMLPIQAAEIQKLFGDSFDFRFITSDTPTQQAQASTKHVDYVLLNTSFVNHSMQDALRGHEGFIFCKGGVTGVCRELDKLKGQTA